MAERQIYEVSDKNPKYRTEIQQMMFVSGETGEVSVETTTLIEQIVHEQVIEMLKRATELANRAGLRNIHIDHIIFLLRHDKPKVARVKHFLAWKEVRKSAKDNDEKGPGDADFDVNADPLGGGSGAPTGPIGAEQATKNINKNKKAKVRLPWDVHSYYNMTVPDKEDEEVGADEIAEEEEQNAALMERLRANDERTKNMTKEEYVHFSECRQSSFTFRKTKRFREWAGIGILTEAKLDPDIQDILGFLTFEMVQSLTEAALEIKAEEDAWARLSGNDTANGAMSNVTGFAAAFGRGGGGDMTGTKRKRDGEDGYEGPVEERTPVDVRHIQEAFRFTQARRGMDRGMQAAIGRKVRLRRPLKFI